MVVGAALVLEDPLNDTAKDKTTIPMISSMIAALVKAEPTRESYFPISFKVATVILTEVAVKMTP